MLLVKRSKCYYYSGMDLNSYLKTPGAPTVKAFRLNLVAHGSDVKSDAQIRQWQHGYNGRLPDTANSVLIEKASSQSVMRWDLRPLDWHKHWPELIGKPGAPELATPTTAGA